ncbi:hypothetical protein BELL_0215g00030 [Botrytis elliptica]|uniref:Aminoglycoside phosphotransferase domain-containing protein n=1 Tax=Botrytis elliptica TaxID=278938 RepID=A0A4Z1JP49_9HELO|nr:hypothetical protein BELL_0215g00030 [Botrytis elliptica]
MESDKARALSIVRNAELVHPGLPLVEAFLSDAIDGEQAARYLLQTYVDDRSNVNFVQFLKDWKDLLRLFYVESSHSRNLSWALKRRVAKRDDCRCCLTGVRCRFWSNWNVFPIIPPTALCMKEVGQTNPIAYFWHFFLILVVAKYSILYNNIGGNVPAMYTYSQQVKWKCDLVDHSNSGIESPDPYLLDIQSRLSKALKWAEIDTKINGRTSLRRSQNTTSSAFRESITTTFLVMWSKFPEFVRFKTYRVLRTVGSYLYGSTTRGVQRLPFGMYLKYGPEYDAGNHAGEFNALKIVRSRTSIPVPNPIDLLVSPTESFLVMSRIEGVPAGHAIDECSDEEVHQIAQDLRSYIAELHTIEQNKDSKYAITNATGGPCLDYRIDSEPVGPFPTEKEFSESLQLGILPGLMHRTDHKIFFTHADLNMRNILVKDGKISGIVDWENSGWYPEYWEYIKCRFSVKIHKRWVKMIDETFENKYEEELAIDRQYWDYQSAW